MTPERVIVPVKQIKDMKDFKIKPNVEKGEWRPDQPVPRL
jgi:hypothetical protein